MSDAKPLNLTAFVSKKTKRAKARLMQNLGKTDRTTDELFEVYQLNYNKQQSSSLSLQKHLKHYFHCLKELHEASKNLSQCIVELHEKEWPKHDVIENNGYESDHINEDLEEKIKESVLVPLEQYLGQFTEIREKIAKRGRKLVDFDSERHAYESLQANQSGKACDDAKINKCRDQMAEAQRVYEAFNNELHEELPALYENRVPFIITVLQRLYSSQLTYHNENVNLCKSYLDTIEHLAKATEKGSLTSVRSGSSISTTNTSPTTKKLNVPAVPNALTHSQHPNNSFTSNTNNNSNNTTNDSTDARKPGELLHKVRATYKYIAEDEDELSFEAGDVIQVVEYDDPQEQEEGWLVGVKETGEKGLFPANFTKAI